MVDAAFAQAVPAAAPSAVDQMLHMLVILAITVGIFYFMIIRPQRRKQKETEAMLQSVRKGDRVLTSGGVFGTVVGKKGTAEDVIVIKVADDVKMEFTKQSIVQVLERSD